MGNNNTMTGITIRPIYNCKTCSIIISKKSVGNKMYGWASKIKESSLLYSYVETSRNLKCKFDGTLEEAERVIKYLNASID
jgi:hypothetical protein